MRPVWLRNQVNRLLQRSNHNEMSTASTSTETTSSASREEEVPSPSTVDAKKRESVSTCVRKKMVSAANDVIKDDSQRYDPCASCLKRNGKYQGENCKSHDALCRLCCYQMFLSAFEANRDATLLTANCPHCFQKVTELSRVKPKRVQDENSPNVGEESPPETSFSLRQFAEIYIKNENGNDNPAYESSSSS